MNCFVNFFQLRKDLQDHPILPFIQKRRSRNVQILTYHRVNDDLDPFFPGTPLETFARQMEYLTTHFYPCSLQEAVERVQKKDIPPNAVVVTFDDGYRDNYVNAFPILKNYFIPATFFLATEAINSVTPLWHDEVFSAFRETRAPILAWGNDGRIDYPLRTLQEKLFAQMQVLRFLRTLGEKERGEQVQRLKEQLRVVNDKETPSLMLTWDEVRIMHRAGMFFGSHTMTHPILTKLPLARVKEEVYESKRIIEKYLSCTVTAFAYPNGSRTDFNEETKDILKEVGYNCAVTTIFGSNENTQDLFELRRGGPWEDHIPTFAVKLHWYKFCA